MQTKERVSNEQAKADIECSGTRSCKICVKYHTICKACEHTTKEYAEDLLDARKERDEARAMILEMRKLIISLDEYIECSYEGTNYKKDERVVSILERTKEYAE